MPPGLVAESVLSVLRERLGRSTGAEQRRQATILFADISGFTALSERLDAEDVNREMNTLWRRLDRLVAAHGGTIDKHIGDALMCVWGWDRSREDDPLRAVRAALAMRDALDRSAAARRGEGLRLHIGINTGPVVLGGVGTQGERSVIGDAVNTASRLEGAAHPGEIVISESTWRQVRGLFEAEPLPPVRLKGKRSPVPAYRVLREGARATAVPARGIEGIDTSFIGREQEVEVLREAFRDATGNRRCRFLAISAEAGMGKSRLLREFDAWVRTQEGPPDRLSVRARQDLEDAPYSLLRTLFAARFGIRDSDPSDTARGKLVRGFREALGGSMSVHANVRDVARVLGYGRADAAAPTDPVEEVRQAMARALGELQGYLAACAGRATVVLTIDDAHWADTASLDAIEELGRRLAAEPVLIMVAARPDLLARRPLRLGALSSQQVALRPLDAAQTRRLVSELVSRTPGAPDGLADIVHERAEGNPFFVEEFVRMLGEEGARGEGAPLEGRRVPTTLTGIIQARIDGLSATERRVLQRASVVGRVFWEEAVDCESPRAAAGRSRPMLASLQSRAMVFARERASFEGAHEFIFKHSVLRDVAYDGILKRDRRRYHALVAGWLIRQSGERADEIAALIAEHLHRAGREDLESSYLAKAGFAALAQSAGAEAARYLDRALALTPAGDRGQRFDLIAAREQVHDLQGNRDAQREDLAALAELAEALDDDARRADIALRRAALAEVTGDYDESLRAAGAAADLARGGGAARIEASARLRWARALWRRSDFAAAREQLGESLRLSRGAGLARLEADGLRTLGGVLLMQGDNAEARRHFEQALDLYRRVGDRRGESTTLGNLGISAQAAGDFVGAKEAYERTLALCREIGDRRGEARQLSNLGTALRDLGAHDASAESYRRGLALSREMGDAQSTALALVELGLNALETGDPAATLDFTGEALGISARIGARHEQAAALTAAGHALLDLGRPQESEQRYRQALAIREDLREEAAIVENLADLARSQLARGDLCGALQLVERILPRADEATLRAAQEPVRVILTCGEVLAAGHDERSAEILRQARARVLRQAERISDPELRRSYLASRLCREALGSSGDADPAA